MNIVGVIPARMAATRFPGKPLAKILGIPMIGHVYLRSKMSKALTDLYIATCDQEIADYAVSIGAKFVMTSDQHERCSDRCAEAMLKIEESTGKKVDILMMIQGDEPMTFPEMIDEALAPMMTDPGLSIVNLMGEIHDAEDFNDPNEVKVVTDRQGNALYFSREAIPSVKKQKGPRSPLGFKQVPIIPFRRDFLLQYNEMAPTPLEVIESVDMMRILENGMKVRMVKTALDTVSVDTPEDLELVSQKMKNDALVPAYVQ